MRFNGFLFKILVFLFTTLIPISVFAKTNLVFSEGYSQTQISGAASVNQSSALNLGLAIEHFGSQNIGNELFFRTTYLTSQGLVSSMAIGFGLNWYFTESSRARRISDGTRDFSESEITSVCLVFRAEAGRQLLRSFSSLGELEASSEFLGFASGFKLWFNFTPSWAPGIYLLGGYNKGFGRFPFDAMQIQTGALVSLAL